MLENVTKQFNKPDVIITGDYNQSLERLCERTCMLNQFLPRRECRDPMRAT